MLLSDYLSNVTFLLNDPLNQFYSSANLTNCINRARTEVAKKSGCIRRVTPSSAALTSITVSSGGSGYTSATVSVSGPDAIGGNYVTATATATLSGGAVSAINLTNPGTGYVNPPTVTITGNGTGATAVAVVGSHWTTTANQEVYAFSAATTVLQAAESGLQAVVGVMDIAVSWGAQKPILNYLPWSAFQAYCRSVNMGNNYPYVWSQFRTGEAGQVYLFQIPSAVYEMQWDCICTPQALSGTQSVDLIPDNWTNAVFYYACYFAYMNAQRKDDANDMYQRYERALAEESAFAQPARTPSYYDGDS